MRRFFSILFLLLAIGTVVLGVRSTGVSRHGSMLLVAVPALDQDLVREMVRGGDLPVLAEHLATGLNAQIMPSPVAGSAGFWGRALTGDSEVQVQPSPQSPATIPGVSSHGFWRDLSPEAVALVGFPRPRSGPEDSSGLGLYPVGDVVDGFVGSSEGRIFVWKRLTHGLFDWPYSGASSAASEVVADLEVDHWSEWIPLSLEGTRHGVFRLYRLGPDSVYATPVYATQMASTERPDASSDPSVVAVRETPALAKVLFSEARIRADSRVAAAAEFLSNDRRLVVYLETLARFARDLDQATGDSAGRPLEREAYRQLDGYLARILASAGPDTLLVILGQGGKNGEAAVPWLMASNRRGRELATVVAVPNVAPSLAYLAGDRDLSGFAAGVAPTVRAAFRPAPHLNSRRAQTDPRPVPSTRDEPIDVLAMQDLGLLSLQASTASAP